MKNDFIFRVIKCTSPSVRFREKRPGLERKFFFLLFHGTVHINGSCKLHARLRLGNEVARSSCEGLGLPRFRGDCGENTTGPVKLQYAKYACGNRKGPASLNCNVRTSPKAGTDPRRLRVRFGSRHGHCRPKLRFVRCYPTATKNGAPRRDGTGAINAGRRYSLWTV